MRIATRAWSAATRFLRDTRGSTSLINIVLAIPVVASAGVAIDFARATRVKEHLQHAVDAAALAAGATKTSPEWSNSKKFEKKAEVARSYLAAELARVNDVELIGTPRIVLGPNTVDVTVDARVEATLVNIVNAIPSIDSSIGTGSGGNSTTMPKRRGLKMTISSKVGYIRDSYLCLLSLHPTQKEAIFFQGNSEFMANCSVQANSDNLTAIRTWGNAYAQADSFCAVGGWAGSGFSPDPFGGCKYKPDPYASLELPAASGCDYNGTVVKNVSATLSPGTYCGGLTISTHGEVTLQPGLYIIKDGALSIDSQSALSATGGVTFYLTGNSSTIDIKSGARVNVVAPNNDTALPATVKYKGFAFLQDRGTAVGSVNQISSKGEVDITGAIYTPSQALSIWANGDMNTNSKYFPMVVRSFEMNGTATLFVNFNYPEAKLDEPKPLKAPAKVFVSR